VERWEGVPRPADPTSAAKPVLFVMMNDTAEADDVGGLAARRRPREFAGNRLLIIHTNRGSGDVASTG